MIGYLDPGSGSLLVQLILGGAAAVAVTGKMYWRRFRSLLGMQKRGRAPDQP